MFSVCGWESADANGWLDVVICRFSTALGLASLTPALFEANCIVSVYISQIPIFLLFLLFFSSWFVWTKIQTKCTFLGDVFWLVLTLHIYTLSLLKLSLTFPVSLTNLSSFFLLSAVGQVPNMWEVLGTQR